MKKILFGVFAHPDDEAFGPSGTLYKLAKSGTDIHLVLVTDGENGTNCDNCRDLGAVRLTEWQQSGELIGVKSQKALHYQDGCLCNDSYLKIARTILKHIEDVLTDYSEPIQVDFMTFDTNGITGHIDHVTTSLITTFIYEKLKKDDDPAYKLGKLLYYCLPEAVIQSCNINWLLMPAGRKASAIDERIDCSDVAQHKLKIMKAHHSQRDDLEKVLEQTKHIQELAHIEHFYYYEG